MESNELLVDLVLEVHASADLESTILLFLLQLGSPKLLIGGDHCLYIPRKLELEVQASASFRLEHANLLGESGDALAGMNGSTIQTDPGH